MRRSRSPPITRPPARRWIAATCCRWSRSWRGLEARHPGRIVEVELEDEDGLWLYEIEVLTPEGRLIEIELDARTGAILGYEEDDD